MKYKIAMLVAAIVIGFFGGADSPKASILDKVYCYHDGVMFGIYYSCPSEPPRHRELHSELSDSEYDIRHRKGNLGCVIDEEPVVDNW